MKRLLLAQSAVALVIATGCVGNTTNAEATRPARISLTRPIAPVVVVGGNFRVAATVYDREGRTIPLAKIVWESNAPTILTVTDSGMVRPTDAGKAVVRVQVKDMPAIADTVEITVIKVG